MKNFYQKSKLIDQETIAKIEKALELSWSIETTDPESKEKWSEENKAIGQCAVTAILIFDLFGGRMIYDKKNFHIWNEFPDGTQQDFTRSQFTDVRTFSVYNRFAGTPHSSAGGEGKARFQASTKTNSKVEAYKFKTKEDILHDERGRKNNILEKYQKLKQRFLKNLNSPVTREQEKVN